MLAHIEASEDEQTASGLVVRGAVRADGKQRLSVGRLRCEGLRKEGLLGGDPDPYLVMRVVDGAAGAHASDAAKCPWEATTAKISNERDPCWEGVALTTTAVACASSRLEVEVWDHDVFGGDDFIAMATIELGAEAVQDAFSSGRPFAATKLPPCRLFLIRIQIPSGPSGYAIGML